MHIGAHKKNKQKEKQRRN